MSSAFSESNLIKKLENVTNTQDSIQTLSLWVLHHKTHYKQIVEQWLKCYLRAKSSHQLALFYLANDIVQHAKRKSLTHYLNQFMDSLREAVKVTNDAKIVSNINRVFNIWQERNIYSKEFIDELRELLCGEDVKLELLSKIVSDYSSSDIIQEISNTSKAEQLTKGKVQGLLTCKFDFASADLFNKLKDKSYGEQFSKEFDETTKCLDAVIGALENEVSSRKEMLLKLDKAKIFYDIQLKEAKTVIEAFSNCETRVNQVKTLLNNSSSSQNSSLATDGISTSTLSTVISIIQQAQQIPVSSLDQRLSLMSHSGQFGLSLNQDNQVYSQAYDPSYQAGYNPSHYADQYYLPQEGMGSQSGQIESVIGLHSEPIENLEPADMDLGDSDDDDGPKKIADLNNKNNMEDKMKRRPVEMPFIDPQSLSGLFPLIPPPPPPPLPPPALKDLFGPPPSLEEEYDPYRSNPNLTSIVGIDSGFHPGNSIRNLADRANRNSTAPYHPSNSGHGSNHWRNSSDNRQSSRNHKFNPSHHNSGHGNRWKNNNNNSNNNRGSWKRSSYGSQLQ